MNIVNGLIVFFLCANPSFFEHVLGISLVVTASLRLKEKVLRRWSVASVVQSNNVELVMTFRTQSLEIRLSRMRWKRNRCIMSVRRMRSFVIPIRDTNPVYYRSIFFLLYFEPNGIMCHISFNTICESIRMQFSLLPQMLKTFQRSHLLGSRTESTATSTCGSALPLTAHLSHLPPPPLLTSRKSISQP